MKKINTFLLTIVIMVIVCVSLSSCAKDEGETYYVAAADFFYSNDKGHSYGNGTKEYSVGETVYMKVKAKVTSNKEVPETIKIKLTIPNITALDAKYYDGQPITPTYDAIQNITTYEFTITAALNAQEWEFVFQFIPNAEAEVLMTLIFDDHLDSMYDKQNTIKFVASEATKEE
mgnify:CR=1 FL=1